MKMKVIETFLPQTTWTNQTEFSSCYHCGLWKPSDNDNIKKEINL